MLSLLLSLSLLLPAPPADPCREALDRALSAMTRGAAAEAEAEFREGLELCPENPSLLREFAGLRFRQSRHGEARELALRLLQVEPDDVWAHDLVGSTHYMEGASLAALASWNRIHRPVLREVRTGGGPEATLRRLSGVQVGQLLTPGGLAGAGARLADLPSLRSARSDVRPLPGGEAALVLEVERRPPHPFRLTNLPGHLLRGLRGEVELQTAGLLGGLEWARLGLRREGSLRSGTVTGVHPMPAIGGWVGGGLLGWGVRGARAQRARGPVVAGDSPEGVRQRDRGLRVAWIRRAPDRLLTGVHGGIEDRKTPGDEARGGAFVGVGVRLTPRVPEPNRPPPRHLAAHGEAGRAGDDGWWRASLEGGLLAEFQGRWELSLQGGVDAVSREVPLDREPRFGADRSATHLMRARKASDTHGVIRPAFPGRGWIRGSTEVVRWGEGATGGMLGIALFADGVEVLKGRRGVEGPTSGLDAGIGLRLREPLGGDRVRLDLAVDVSSGRRQLSAAWERGLSLPGLEWE